MRKSKGSEVAMRRKLTAEENRKCAEVVLDFLLQKVEELDDAIYEFIPEEIGDDEEKMKLVIDEFNVSNEQKIIREAFEAKYGKTKREKKRERKYEYGIAKLSGDVVVSYGGNKTDAEFDMAILGKTNAHIVRREVGEWEEVKDER